LTPFYFSADKEVQPLPIIRGVTANAVSAPSAFAEVWSGRDGRGKKVTVWRPEPEPGEGGGRCCCRGCNEAELFGFESFESDN